ncbi:MAG: helix-turn-helix transcriptional regulator [Rhodospirillales bacterium]|nr:helix-turn-helix transcriptional regulator [Alphaproteobacteria bacterium]MCB1839879.1 helix-turn-helix transcriptional regulator [Alphaproteobacteria bacterium]MCB9976635.1 helix-turn-helix transcriptional regulator [Rhodospirillales bacterium]
MASRLKKQRLSMNMTQAQLAERANVSLSVLRKFEQSGKISLESFVKLTFVLGLSERMLKAFQPQEQKPSSLEEIINEQPGRSRKRASNPRKK